MASQRAHYTYLRDKWLERHEKFTKQLVEKHKEAFDWLQEKSKHAAVGSLSGLVLLSAPMKPTILFRPPQLFAQAARIEDNHLDKKAFFIADLQSVLPQTVQPLTEDEEKKTSEVFSRYLHVKATAELDGKRLNRSYGLIGAEQHLMRYGGDTMETHFETSEDSQKYYSSGMAPGRGAWGYFGSDALGTQREKYYLAVQTFLAPGWGTNSRELYNFFKFRKMLVVNPQNGKAMVAVIGDAGPAPFTGKHLGGSPEVMKYLERVDGAAKGPVLYFFLDDPDDKIPLGPIQVVQ